MGSTHSALYYHLVFGTKLRQTLIAAEWEDRLYGFFGGIVRNAGGVLLAAGGTSDHVHLLLSLKPAIVLSELVRDLKRDTSKWVHESCGSRQFGWQDGYGIFSVSVSSLDAVTEYIRNQREHHRTTTFQDEYVRFLERHGIAYDPRYL